MRIFTTTTLMLASVWLATTPALAENIKLTWSDLDLTTPAGKAELDRRIETVAEKACTPEPVTGTRIQPQPVASCVADTRKEIAAQVSARTAQLAAAGMAGHAATAEARN
jgi:UrcA family protein